MPDKHLPPLGNDAARRAHFIVGDPIRGAAALFVFSFHVALAALFVSGFQFNRSAYDAAFGPIPSEILDNAELAVYAFFALSGYLIGRPFVHAYLQGERSPGVPKYLRRRILRIMPGFLVVVTIALLRFGTLDASSAEVVEVYVLAQAYDLTPSTLVQGIFGHLWTVSTEMGFYLLLPVGMFALLRFTPGRLGMRGRFSLLLAGCLAVALGSLAIRYAQPQTVGYSRWLSSVLFAFTPGVMLAALEAFLPSRAPGARWSRVAVPVLVGVGLVLCLAFATMEARSPTVLAAFAALGTSALIGAALVKQWSGRGTWRILDIRPLHWIGQRSYSFYLIHVPILWDLQGRLEGRIDDPKLAFAVLFAAALSLSAGFAALGFQYVERPYMEMDRWPWQRPKSMPSPAIASEVATPEPALVPER